MSSSSQGIYIYIYIYSSPSLVSVLLPGEKRPAKSGNIELKMNESALAPGVSSKNGIYANTHMHAYIYTYNLYTKETRAHAQRTDPRVALSA